MSLADLRDGGRVFIDANVFIYHFGGRSLFPLTLAIIHASAEVRKSEGLLTNDSFVVAIMREQGIVQLATANGDFDRVSGIEIYKPADLERQDASANPSS